MNIDDLTVKQIREISALVPGCKKSSTQTSDFEVGETVLIRTVTFYWIGTVTKANNRFVTLEPAAWIADTGRFYEALSTGTLNEVEPCKGKARIGVGSIIDIVPWLHAVPTVQK